jgi:hypothetical protein
LSGSYLEVVASNPLGETKDRNTNPEEWVWLYGAALFVFQLRR